MMMSTARLLATRVGRASGFAPVLQRFASRNFAVAAAAGEDIGLNWSLVDDDITPMKNAFRNLNERGLIQRAKGTHGPNKSLAIPARSEPAGPADADAVRHALSHVEDVFVVDAAVGSYRGSEVLVRAVTDDAAVALFLRHLLVRTGGASTAETGSAHPIKVLHSSAGAPGLSSSVNELGATIVATGDISFEHLQEAITAATHALMATGEGEFDVLPLAANAYVDGNSGATTLEVDLSGNSSMPTALKKGSRLYGANGVVWSQGGLARLFRGAVVDEKTAAALGAPLAGDIVVGGKTVVTSFNADNVVAAPSEVVFLNSGKKGGKKASGADLLSGVARLDVEVEKFAALVDKHKVKISTR